MNKKIESGDIVLWGYAKGGGERRNVVIHVGRKYATIRREDYHPKYTFQDIKVPIAELELTGEKFKLIK